MDKIAIGNNEFRADTIPVFQAKIMLIQGTKGLLGCGYFNKDTADKLGHALAIVTGVSSYEEMLQKEVKAVSTAAEQLGVKVGMTGYEALLLMK